MLRLAFGSVPRVGALARWLFAAVVCVAVPLAPPPSAETAKVLNFAPDDLTGWQLLDDEFIPPPGGPGPVVSDPAHPYVSFYRFPRNPKPTFRVADLTNPILQPWAREHLRRVNERSLSGQVVAIPKERCWPVGVPAFLLLPATPVYFLQTPKQVVMIWMQDHHVRRIRMNEQHATNTKPSWFGDSVGHYEGDTLVIDTIRLDTRTYVDNYFTAHSGQLRVVERIRMLEGGRTLEVKVHVEDPGAFA